MLFKISEYELDFRAQRFSIIRPFLITLVMLFIGTFLLSVGPTLAQDSVPLPSATAATEPASVASGGLYNAPVIVEGRTIVNIAERTQEQAQARAERVNLRLKKLIEREDEVAKFTGRDLVIADGEPLITLGSEPILTVTSADAERNLMPSRDLALVWGGKLSVAVTEARSARANPLRGVGYLIRYSMRDLVVSVTSLLPRLAGAILVWCLFWALARGARSLMTAITERIPMDANLRQLACSIAFYGVWAAGLVAILSTLGIESTSIATAVGISGFVLGFAFKDILSHFFAGLMLLTSRQFQIGGQIVVGQYEGVVERIELRALYLRTFDNRLVTIPNGDVFTSVIVSNTSYPYRRREFFVGIGYEQEIEHALEIALKTMRETEGVLDDPEPIAVVDSLDTSSVRLKLMFFIKTDDPRAMHIVSDCIRNVKQAFEDAEVSMPGDVRTIRVHNLDGPSSERDEVIKMDQQRDGMRPRGFEESPVLS